MELRNYTRKEQLQDAVILLSHLKTHLVLLQEPKHHSNSVHMILMKTVIFTLMKATTEPSETNGLTGVTYFSYSLKN